MERTYCTIEGVQGAFVAEVLSDTASAYLTGTVKEYPPVDSIDWTSSQAYTPLYGNDAKLDDRFGTAIDGVVVRFVGISESDDAWLRGKSRIAATGRIVGSGTDKPPLRALGLKITQNDDDIVGVWFLKGRFSGGNVVTVTKKDGVTVNAREYTFSPSQTTKKFTFLDAISGKTKTKGITWFKGETSDPVFDDTEFFSQVQTPDTTGAPDAPALSSIVPADEATGVAVSANVVLTFNNQITSGYVALMDDTGGVVAAAQTWDDTGKILTINPASDMEAASLHIVAVQGVTDIFGQVLAPVTKTFTTA